MSSRVFFSKIVIVSVLAVVACTGQGTSDWSAINTDDSADASTVRCPYDTTKNRWHCGECGHACKPGEVCSNSVCKAACDPPLVKCAGEENCIDLQADLAHCGSCDALCLAPRGGAPAPSGDAGADGGSVAFDRGQRVATAVCQAGQCTYTCPQGASVCALDGCFDLKLAQSHCGTCDLSCGSTSACMQGLCCVTATQLNCNGQCANVKTDLNNCGTCANKCPTNGHCTAGVCGCNSGQAVCNSTCTSTGSDVNNCGSCGHVCTVVGQLCQSSQCVCPTAKPDTCNNTCVDTKTDPNNCGGCGNVCPLQDELCVTSNCQCPAYAADTCNGACVDMQSDANNCTECGTPCPNSTPNCYGGSCVAGTLYSEGFVQGAKYVPADKQCADWNAFRASLTGSYSSITVSGTFDAAPGGLTCDVPATVNQITNALNTGAILNTTCNGKAWRVGTYASTIALTVDMTTLFQCKSNGYAVAPCATAYWGGINDYTCGGKTQRMQVYVQ
jgi:hypothetical protein